MKQSFLFYFLIAMCVHVFGQAPCNPSSATGTPNCSAASSTLTPINDLGTNVWNNNWNGTPTQGGLYPNGSNYRPAAHNAAGLALAQQVQPLDASGNPNLNGKIVLLSIGLSNTTIEACEFDSLANTDGCKNPKVVCVNGAMGQATAMSITSPWFQSGTPYNNFWNNVNTQLASAGVTGNQVQAIWFKETDQATPSISDYRDSLVVQFKRAMLELVTRFPNVKLAYVSSRISARYSCLSCGNAFLNPEPYAYVQGWACKQLIEDQINGLLPYAGAGKISPWLSWGPYMWSNGSTAQITNPGISWNCPVDFAADGTHPSIIAARKVANLLLTHFKTDSTTCPWFNSCCTITAAVNENSFQPAISISPNPTNGNVNVNLPEGVTEKINIALYNCLGKKVYEEEKKLGTSEKIIALKDLVLQSGIYFINLSNEEINYTAKLTIIK